jgi:hypothetical protein
MLKVAMTLVAMQVTLAYAEPAPPTAPKELADYAKQLATVHSCALKALGPDMKSMVDATATFSSKLEQNGFWNHVTYDTKMGGMPFHFDEYTTYDGAAKTFRRVMVESMGSFSVGTAPAQAGGKMEWELTSQESTATGTVRDHEDFSDPKAFKSWGEMSMDHGKTWTKFYEQSCKR